MLAPLMNQLTDILHIPDTQSARDPRRVAIQRVGIKEVDDGIWLVSFMHYDLGYFDDETYRLEPIANPFSPKVLPMSPE